MEKPFWGEIHPIFVLIAIWMILYIGYVIYDNKIRIESRLEKVLNNWVWENGEPYKNAVSLTIFSTTKEHLTDCKTYDCSFITIVKDNNGEFNNYVEGVARIIKTNKEAKKMYNTSERFMVVSCDWHGITKSLKEDIEFENMLLDGLYNGD